MAAWSFNLTPQVCVYVCECVNVSDVCKDKRPTSGFILQEQSTLFCWNRSFIEIWGLSWLSSEPQGSACLCLPSAGITNAQYLAWSFYSSCGSVEVLPHVPMLCTASTLLTEPPPQPFVCFCLQAVKSKSRAASVILWCTLECPAEFLVLRRPLMQVFK